MTDALLTLEEVEIGYGALRIVHGISLCVADKSVTALIGGNGAGKTTLMGAIAGIVPTQSGTVRFCDRDITHLNSAERVADGLVLVPEGRLIFPRLTVEENLRLGGITPPARAHIARRLAENYELFPRLAERRRQMAGTLSGGEQQMLAIGRGLMAGPRLLLLDEPSLGLAPMMVDMVFETIDRARASGLTILLAEQNVGRSLELANHAYVIENGSIALYGAGRDLLSDDRVRTAYLGI